MVVDVVDRDVPVSGTLVSVRDRRWVVVEVARSSQPADTLAGAAGPEHLVTLASVDDDEYEEARLVWELEPGARTIDRAALPPLDLHRVDAPDTLDAFLDAVRWGAVTSADARALQAPFRAGIAIEDYQLDPVVRALRMPRTNLLIADDVGLGKTIEAGLVVQELLLRHRARTVLVVCPSALQIQWRDQMRDKFGLDFRIVDADLLRSLRRTRGLRVNPWTHFPRLIVSIDWLKRDRPMALLREILPAVPTLPRRFDLLIVDEVHGAAPAGNGARYATDTQRTQAIRALAPHCEHRLFLSATPHNGYANSFSALLELLDSQRFARGVPPDREQLARVMVRRLKSELKTPDGARRFPPRRIVPLPVKYSGQERTIHQTLADYAASRARRASARGEAERVATEFVLLLLKKRLFSCPAAFARTLAQHADSLARRGAPLKPSATAASVLRRRIEELEQEDFADEQAHEDATEEALDLAAGLDDPLTPEEREKLDSMRAYAERERHLEDTKCAALLDWLDATVRPGGAFNEERVLVFTEYRDTQRYLQERLAARGYPAERVALLSGGMDEDARELIKARFQAGPELDPVRILLATDAASEGIDLQRHCHRLVHYEIPWNPNRLEQRNGRIDRHGQTASEVLIHHFVGAGWEQAPPGSLEADLQFLAVAAAKVAQIEEDLGSVGPVIARQVQEAMLGRRQRLDTAAAERAAPSRRLLRAERDLRAEVARLRDRLDESRAALRIEPDRVRHVVEVALALAGQPALTPLGEGRYRVGALTGSWAPATIGLEHPITGAQRPVVFDHTLAAGRDDVALVHLNHRLVQLAAALLRAEVWKTGAGARLARVTVRLTDHGDAIVLAAHGRLVVTGASGRRLHEEVISAGGSVRDGRFARLGGGELEAALAAAGEESVPARVLPRLAARIDGAEAGLRNALERRAADRAASLERVLGQRAHEDAAAATAVLTELRRSIEATLAEPDHEQLELFSVEERRQLTRDTEALRRRLDAIPADIAAEVEAIQARYADPVPRLFPAAVTLVVPRSLALA